MGLYGIAFGCLLAWIALRWFRGDFWRTDHHVLQTPHNSPSDWPEVTAVVPARNEAESIGATVRSILEQDYPGELNVIVVDDCSDDGTGVIARRAASGSDRLEVIQGCSPPSGWTGKLWALDQGVQAATNNWSGSRWLWFTDADIVHAPDTLRQLVGKAHDDGLALISLMVRLRCEEFWERLLIPAFIFFFQKLFPFPWVNDPLRRTAAAAGGCVLICKDTLTKAGGIAVIRDQLIDDCALAAMLKPHGKIWLGHARGSISLRRYQRLQDVWMMVARTAFFYLDHTPWRLVLVIFGMLLLYQLPWVTLVLGVVLIEPNIMILGVMTVGLQISCYKPTVRVYQCSPAWALSLPFAAFLYTAMTLDSARRYWLGCGGEWKGRMVSSNTLSAMHSQSVPHAIEPDPSRDAPARAASFEVD